MKNALDTTTSNQNALLLDLAVKPSKATNLDELITHLPGILKHLLDFDCCALSLRNDPGCYDTWIVFNGSGNPGICFTGIPAASGMIGQVLEKQEPLLIQDYPHRKDGVLADDPALGNRVQSVLSCPILTEHGVLGAITFSSAHSNLYTNSDMRLGAAIASVVSVHVERFQLIDNLLRANQTTQEAEAAEAKKSAILESAIDAILTIDHQGKVQEWNAAAERIFGYSKAQAIGKEMAELVIPPRYRERHYQGIAHYLATGEGPIMGKLLELPAMRADGSEFLAELTVTRVALEGMPMFTGTMRDITERKQAQQALQESENQLRLITDSLPVLISFTDKDLYYRFANTAYEQWFGHPLAEIVDHTMYEVLGSAAVERLRPYIDEALSGRAVDFEEWIHYRNAGFRHVQASYVPRKTSDGSVEGFYVLVTDITAKKQAEAALKESEQLYRLVVEGANDGVWDWDIDQDKLQWNDRLSEILELSIPDEERSFARILKYIPSKDAEQVRRGMSDHLETDSKYEVEFRFIPPSGTVKYLISRGKAIRDKEGQAIRMLGSITDITERKQAEIALQKSFERERLTRRVAELANKALDLQTLLNTVAQEMGKYFNSDRTAVVHYKLMGNTEYRVNLSAQFALSDDVLPMDFSNVSPKLLQLIARASKRTCHILRDSNCQDYLKTLKEVVLKDQGLAPEEQEQFSKELEYLLIDRYQIKANLCVPVIYRDKLYGTITIQQSTYERVWEDEEVDILQELAVQVGNAFYQIELFQEEQQAKEALQKAFKREQLTRRVAELSNQGLDLDKILQILAHELGEFFQADRAFVIYLERSEDTYHLNINTYGQFCRSEEIFAYDPSGMSPKLQGLYTRNRSIDSLMTIIRVSTPEEYAEYSREYLEKHHLTVEERETLYQEIIDFNIGGERLRALLRLPIIYRGIPYGNIILHQCLSDRIWTDEEVAILQEVATQVGTIFYQTEISQKETQAKEALQKNLKREHLIRKVVEAIGQSFDINLILKTVAKEVGHYLQVDRASVSRYYLDQGKLILDASAQYTRNSVKPIDNEDLELLIKAVQHLTPESLTQGEPQITNIANQEEYVAYMRERMSHFNFPDLPTEKLIEMVYKYEIQASLRVSIRYRGIPYGSISVSQISYNRQWQPEEVELLKTIAEHAGSAIFQAELYRQEQQANKEAKIRAEQQEVVTEIGLKALSGIELQELMDTAVDEVAKTLDVNYVKLMALMPGDETVLLKAGIGWQEGLVGTATESTGLGSPAGYVLLRKEPVIVEDLRTEIRFSASSLLLDHGVVSGISLVIFTDGMPWGVMGAYSKQLRKFSKQDVNFFQSVANVIATAIERKQIEQEKDRAKEEAQEASRKKSEFLAMMSHELRTPLNSIIGYSRMIENGMGGPLTDDQNKYIKNVGSSGNHLLNIVNDLLDVSKAEAGKMVISPGIIEIRPIAEEVQAMMQELAKKSDVFVSFQIQPNIDTIEADPSRFKQILINLTSNAIKFNKKGGTVSVCLNKTEDGEWLIGDVEDTGIGIAQEKQAELFKKFYQVDTTASRPHEGTGLGLALTKELIELHEGEISLTSEEGMGTTFTFRLPTRTRVKEKVKPS